MQDQTTPGGVISPNQANKSVTATDEVTQKAAEIATQRIQGELPSEAAAETVTIPADEALSVPEQDAGSDVEQHDIEQDIMNNLDNVESVQPDSVASVEESIPIEPVIEHGVSPAPEVAMAPVETPEQEPVQQPADDTVTEILEQPPVIEQAASQAMPEFMTPPVVPNAIASQNQIKATKKRIIAPVLLAVILFAVLGGGTVAGYFGIMIPNKPENKILSALTDFASQTVMTTEGIVDYTPEKAGTGVSMTYKAATDIEKKQLSVVGTVGIKGTQFPYESRYIDKNIYMKVGGLGNLAGVLPADATTAYGPYLNTLKKINDQWYVIDSSYIQSLGGSASCVTDLSFVLTDSDKDIIKNAYEKHPLFTIKSTTNEKVDGIETTKFVVDPASDTVASAFGKEVSAISVVKKIKDCGSDIADEKTASNAISSVKKDAASSIAIFVTNDKKLKKLEIYTKEDAVTVKMTAVFKYGPVSIVKPENAKPLQDLLGGLMVDVSTSAKR